jgi:hypothetical protein
MNVPHSRLLELALVSQFLLEVGWPTFLDSEAILLFNPIPLEMTSFSHNLEGSIQTLCFVCDGRIVEDSLQFSLILIL